MRRSIIRFVSLLVLLAARAVLSPAAPGSAAEATALKPPPIPLSITPSPLMGEGWGEGDKPRISPLVPPHPTLSRQGRGDLKQPLNRRVQWFRVTRAWREAEAVVSGRRGAYPFTAATKQQLLIALASAVGEIAPLRGAGLITETEETLVKTDLYMWIKGVQAVRTVEQQRTDPYPGGFPVPPIHADPIWCLQRRLALLQEWAKAEVPHPDVARKVFGPVYEAFAVLSDRRRVLPVEEDSARRVRDRAMTLVQTIRAKLGWRTARGLEASRPWRLICNTFRMASILSRARPITQEQFDDTHASLDRAEEAARFLEWNSLMAEPERHLLLFQAQRLRRAIPLPPPPEEKDEKKKRKPETAEPAPPPEPPPPPQPSGRERLAARIAWCLPHLERLAADGTAHPPVLRRLLPAIEADLRTASGARWPTSWTDAERHEAARVTRQALAAVEQLKGQMDTKR